ncbi:MAG: hypothetical protein JWM28_3725, partial [Chitinophagaceae bacterium]|nr:hypothetical protein [Chitinophagaceae bacterium]
GTWSPATINTSVNGTTTYTFTPTDPCATIATMNITISTQITPTFTQVSPLCQNAIAPVLPNTSDNGFAGVWSPATINTSVNGTTTYTFTPTDPCATVTTMDIVIGTQVAPVFAQIGPLCLNSAAPALPGVSNNGFAGTWSPATINTATVGTTTYTFIPTDPCATITTMDIVISTQITATFTPVAPVCSGAALSALPTTSNEGIKGVWSPALNNTATTTYTFTPAAGQCAATTTLNITVYPSATSTTNIPVCANQLPYTWNGNSYAATGTYKVTLTSSSGCDSIATLVLTSDQSLQGIRYPAVIASINVPTQLSIRNLGGNYTYDWNPRFGLDNYSIYNPVFNYDRQNEYTIKITSNTGCIATDTLPVKIVDPIPLEESGIFVPKAWSPNGDGHNDKLFPIPVNIKELKYFRVFNRWGQLMFETNVLRDGWNGIFKGQPQVSDTYTWTVEALGEDGKTYRRSGNSVLLR